MNHRLAPANHALQQLRVAQHEAQHGLQHKRAPRPLPLFLELVREAAREEPELARRALAGLARYGDAERMAGLAPRPVVARIGGTCLRDLGGSGSPVVLVPSLINPPNVLDLPGASLAEALAARHRVLLLDWGAAAERAGLDLGGHVAGLLVPLVEGLGEEVSLVGYCLGGTMALAAANLVAVRKVATLAAPWRFGAYPPESRAAGEQGVVILRLTVDGSGRPTAVSVAKSSGHPRLDRAAIEAGWRCRVRDAAPGSHLDAPVRFNLRD